jgi:diadenosine tetraphosphate (Ap4A) HIT family hydrolase
MLSVTDAHIHIQPFHQMPREIAATFWKGKPNRAELEGFAADPRALLARISWGSPTRRTRG